MNFNLKIKKIDSLETAWNGLSQVYLKDEFIGTLERIDRVRSHYPHQ